jgi:hypothetical protein
MADAGHQSRKLARALKRHEGWRLVITKRGQRAFKITGLTWIVERSRVPNALARWVPDAPGSAATGG